MSAEQRVLTYCTNCEVGTAVTIKCRTLTRGANWFSTFGDSALGTPTRTSSSPKTCRTRGSPRVSPR